MAGKTVTLIPGTADPQRGVVVAGTEFEVEDWYDYQHGRGSGVSWQTDSTFTTYWYGLRREATGLPLDDEVLYGHIGGLGHIVHRSEIAGALKADVEGDGSLTLTGPSGEDVVIPPGVRISEEVADSDVFEVVFHGAMRHAFQAWLDEHPAVMAVRTPQDLRRDEGDLVPGYHEFLVIPSIQGFARAAAGKTSVSDLDL
jgi:hypothetical protein